MRIWCDRLIQLGFTSVFTVAGLVIWDWHNQAIAQSQIEADGSMGDEGSTVLPNLNINGIPSDVIIDGARRGQNLFHSFREFNIDAGRGAYFFGPDGVANILSRVTGTNPSEINGVLGTFGLDSNNNLVGSDANLFLINPNGIIFGAGARLDIGGSFAATTANGIQFGDRGFFSATDPEAPSQLLNVDPSAFFFNQLSPGSITNNSIAPAGTRPNGISPVFGLRVPDGESLLLIGGDIDMSNRGSLHAFGGRIELGGLATAGTIGLDITDNALNLTFPDGVARSNVFLGNDALVAVLGTGGGDIVVNANQFSATNGGRLVAGTEGAGNGGDITVNATQAGLSGTGPVTGFGAGIYNQKLGSAALSNAGDITVNAETLNLSAGATINASTSGLGNAGNVTFQISGNMSLSGTVPSYIQSNIEAGGVGEGGNITINAGSLSVTNGSQIQTIVRQGSDVAAAGRGNAGMIDVNVQGAATFEGVDSNGFVSSIITILGSGTTGRGGSIDLQAGTLILRNGASLNAANFGRGDAGNVRVEADTVQLDGISSTGRSSAIFSTVESGAVGNGGTIDITADTLTMRDGAELQTIVRRAGPVSGRTGEFPAGQGIAGDIRLDIAGATVLDGVGRNFPTQIASLLDFGATGRGGNIQLETGSLSITNGARLNASTSGTGNAGRITIEATDEVIFSGASETGLLSGAYSNVENGSRGNSSGINVRTGSFTLLDGAVLSSSTFSNGNAGSVRVEADTVLLEGISTGGRSSGIFSTVEPRGVGNAGTIDVTADNLTMRDGAAVESSIQADPTRIAPGRGNAGTIRLNIAGATTLEGRDNVFTRISSFLGLGTTGQGGNLFIETGSLSATNGAILVTSTAGRGDAGKITIQADDSVEFSGLNSAGLQSGVYSTIENTAVGDSRGIEISAGSLSLSESASIQSFVRGEQSGSVAGRGTAGDIILRVDGEVRIDGNERVVQGVSLNSSIDSSLGRGATGRGGSIDIEAGSLSLLNGGALNAPTFGNGNAGNVRVEADTVLLEGISAGDRSSAIFSTVEPGGVGNGGTIDITADNLTMRDGAELQTIVRRAELTPEGTVRFPAGQGIAGNIRLDVEGETSLDGANIFPTQIATLLDFGATGGGGNIDIETGSLSLTNGARLNASTSGMGNAGQITIDADDDIRLSGVSANGYFSGIFSTIENGGMGNSDGIEIEAGSLRLDRAATIQSLVRPTQTGSVAGQGRAGDITIRIDGNVRIDGTEQVVQGNPFVAQINSSLGAGATGRGGDIFLDAGSLSLLNGGAIAASTFGNGNAGRITIDVDDAVSLSGENIVNLNGNNVLQQSNIATFVAPGAEGNAGRIRINAGSLRLDDFSFISSGTGGRGDAGDIIVRVDGATQLEESSNITSGVGAGGRGRGGDIRLRGRSLTLSEGSQVGAFLFREQFGTSGGRGRGGTITINASEFVDIAGVGRRQLPVVYTLNPSITALTRGFSSGLFTNSERGASGPAGDITVNTRDFRISNGGLVAASTFNEGDGGDIVINADAFIAHDGGQIVTNTRSGGTAGSITLNVSDRIVISGVDATFNQRRAQIREILSQPGQSDRVSDILIGLGNRSGLFVNADADATGNAGKIAIDTTDLTMSDGAIISAVAAGQENAGNIGIAANTVELRNNSDIRTSVTGEGDGGNITIDSNYVVALGDSDILAFSDEGSGGNITLPAFFGEGYVETDRAPDESPSQEELNALDGNDRVDVDASGRVRAGTISTPDTSAIQNSLTELPNTAIDTDNLLANSCVVRNQEQVGTFIITGPGGLPQRPGDNAPSIYPTAPVRSVPDEAKDQSWQPGDPIVEPQGVYQLADGRMVLSRECD